MTGVPSIVAGLFILAAWVLAFGFGYSGFAGALALTVLMLPTVVRSSEEMLKLVPPSLREGGLALGLTRTRVVQRIVLPYALPGIVSGDHAGSCPNRRRISAVAAYRLRQRRDEHEPVLRTADRTCRSSSSTKPVTITRPRSTGPGPER